MLKLESENGKSITTRLQSRGYKHTNDMTPEEMKELGLVDRDGYACKPLENGRFERITDESNTQKCYNIVNKFFAAIGMAEGSSMEQFMTRAISEKIHVGIKVVEEHYAGKDYNNVQSFYALDGAEPLPADAVELA